MKPTHREWKSRLGNLESGKPRAHRSLQRSTISVTRFAKAIHGRCSVLSVTTLTKAIKTKKIPKNRFYEAAFRIRAVATHHVAIFK